MNAQERAKIEAERKQYESDIVIAARALNMSVRAAMHLDAKAEDRIYHWRKTISGGGND